MGIESDVIQLKQQMKRHNHDGNETQKVSSSAVGFSSRVRAYRNNSITDSSTGSFQTTFDTVEWDGLSEYNNSNGVFTAKAAGYYLVHAQHSFAGGTAGFQISTSFTTTGTTGSRTQIQVSTTGASWDLSHTDIIKCAVGDTIYSSRVWQAGGAAGTIFGGSDKTYITIQRLA